MPSPVLLMIKHEVKQMSYFWKNDLVELKMITEEAQDSIFEVLHDTKTRRQADHGIYLPATKSLAEDMIGYAIESSERGDELWFSIVNEKQEMVGYAVVDWINERMGNAQFAVTIFRQFRRLHYGSHAAEILLAYLFHERRFHKVGCCVIEGNMEGESFMESLGFSLDAFRSEMFYTQGRYVGESYYSMLREEYDQHQKAKQGYTQKTYHAHLVPDSTLGISSKQSKKQIAPLYDERPYFWEYDGILLRDMTEEDDLKNHEIIYDTEASIFFDSDVKLPQVKDELTDFEKSHLHFGCDDDRLEFAISDLEGNYVGNINLCGLDKKNGKFSFSIYLLKQFRGKGYASKALRLVLCYAFEELRMHKMISCVNMGNTASAALMRSVGCTVEGVLRDNEYYHGEYVDVVAFGVSREAFWQFMRQREN